MSAIADQSRLMGITACRLLLKSINGDPAVYKEIVPQQLVIRETSAKNVIK
jgi:LacI family transcriptional regulator